MHSLEARGRQPPVKKSQMQHQMQQQPQSFTKNVNNSRSRSENPPKARGLHSSSSKNDDFASRVNPKGGGASRGGAGSRSERHNPPPMPEKTKIHLKNDNSLKQQHKRNGGGRGSRQDQPLPALPTTEPNSLQSSHPYEALPDIPLKKESNDAKYKRSRSLGPVVEAAQKELLASAVAARERSRSRGPHSAQQNAAPVERSTTDSGGRRKGAQPPRENSSLESSNRGRSRTKLERSASNKMKVDVMDPFLGSGGPGGAPPLRGGGMPARQKSMIDLRDPNWDPPKHLFHHHQNGGRQGTPPRHLAFGAPQNMQPHHPGPHVPHGPQPGPHRAPMMRSATEHDIKIRNRRSMAVGPFEDLPPHIRQHMVSFENDILIGLPRIQAGLKFEFSNLIRAFFECCPNQIDVYVRHSLWTVALKVYLSFNLHFIQSLSLS